VFLNVNRLSNLESFESSKHANVVMTSVKPIFQSSKKNVDGTAVPSKMEDNPIDASTLTNVFRYSIPYTQDRSKVHARGVDQQWKRSFILTVKETFPGIYSRQPVMSSTCVELSPIEVTKDNMPNLQPGITV
jgi:Dock homology region 2